MTQQVSPFLETAYGWAYGENGWNAGMDSNLLKFSFLFNGNVDGVVSSLPAAVDGTAYYLTTDSRLYFCVGTTWYSSPTPRWFQFRNKSTGVLYEYNGTFLSEIQTPTQLGGRLDAVEATISSLGTAAFQDVSAFATQSALDVAVGQAQAYTDTLRSDLAATDGSSRVGFIQTGTGAVARTTQAKQREIVSVRDFGAVGDGVADDTSAFQAAFNAGSHIIIPAGTYLITSTLTIAGKAITIKGQGVGVSRLVCNIPTGNGISLTPTDGNHFFDISDFSMDCARPAVSGQWAIRIDGSSQLTSSTYNGKFLTGAREKRRGRIHNVDFGINGDATVNGWANGLRITSLLNFSITSSSFVGTTDARTAEAYAIDGDGVPVDIRFHDVYAYNANIGLNMPDYVEAVYISEVEFVNVNNGVICGRYQAGRSTLANQTLCGSSAMRIGAMHANCRYFGVDLRNAPFCSVKNINVVLNPIAGDGSIYGINVDSANLCAISDNNIYCVTPSNATDVFGVVLANVTNSSASGNKGQGTSFSVYLVDSDGNFIDDNFSFSTTAYTVGGNVGSEANFIGQNFGGATSEYAFASANNLFETINYAGSAVIVISAVASQVASVSIPANTFRQVPQFAIAHSRDGSKIIGSYRVSESTTTSLAFTFQNTDGTTMAAGSYAFSIFASLR